MALTTLPANEGCRSPKKLIARPSLRSDISTETVLGLATRLGFHRMAFFVHRLEPLAIEEHAAAILAAQHRYCACVPAATRMDRASMRHQRVRSTLRQQQRYGLAGRVHFHFGRGQVLREPDAFLQRLGDFLVIQCVAGRIDQPPSIRDSDLPQLLISATRFEFAAFREPPLRAPRESHGRGSQTLPRSPPRPDSIPRVPQPRRAPRTAFS